MAAAVTSLRNFNNLISDKKLTKKLQHITIYTNKPHMGLPVDSFKLTL